MTASASDIGADAVTKTEMPKEYVGSNVWRDIGHSFRLIFLHIKADTAWGSSLWAYMIAASTVSSWLGMQFMLRSADITNALVAGSYDGVVTALIATSLALAGSVGMTFISNFARMTLVIRLRTFLATMLMDRWLCCNKLYAPDRPAIDHPEQRVQEDTYSFAIYVVDMLPLLTGVLSSFFLYSGTLWKLDIPFNIPVGNGEHVAVPHALYVAAILTAIVFTLLAHAAGRALTRLEVVRQRLEAGFRHDLGQAREFSEQIALSRGEAVERERAGHNFQLIRKNWKPFTVSTSFLNVVQATSSFVPMMTPIALLFPLVLSGKMKVGDLQVAGSSFQTLYIVFGSFVTLYSSFVVLRSATMRIGLMEKMLSTPLPRDIVRAANAGASFVARQFEVRKPTGEKLVTLDKLEISAGQKWLIKGRSGTGKSTMLRALSGIWPFGAGVLQEPAEGKRVMFVPQTPYLPNGSLAELLSYPLAAHDFSADQLRKVLHDVGLARLASELQVVQPWSKILSPGEQQRLCLGRVLLQRPDFLFLDEATSALDIQTESEVLAALFEQLSGTAIMAISHKENAMQSNDFVLTVDGGRATVTDLRHGYPPTSPM